MNSIDKNGLSFSPPRKVLATYTLSQNKHFKQKKNNENDTDW